MSFEQLPIDVISALIFPHLSMVEQAHLSRVNRQCRSAASRYYDRLFATLGLSVNQKQLYEGIKNKNREGLRALIPQLNIVNLDRVNGFDPLFFAWLMGLNDILDEIFERVAVPSCRYKAHESRLLLMWGIRTFKSVEELLVLVKCPMDPFYDTSFLTNDEMRGYACEYGHVEVVKRIITQHYSRPFFTPCRGGYFTPLTVAHHYGHYQIVRLLMHEIFRSPYSLLENACKDNDLELVRWLLDRGVLLTPQEAGKILHKLIHWGTHSFAEMTEFLLEQRSVFRKPEILDRALWIGARCGRIEIIRVLRKYGASLDKVYKSNSLAVTDRKKGDVYTIALEEAVFKQHYSVMVFLIMAGSNVRVLFKDPYFEVFYQFMQNAINYGVTKRQIAVKILENYALTDKSAERLLRAFNSAESSQEKFNLFDDFVFRSQNRLSPEMERVYKICLPFLHKPSENEPIIDRQIASPREESPVWRLLNRL